MKIEDKLKGCYIGSAIGDGFGYPTEFLKVDEIKKKWGKKGLVEPLEEIIRVTDDTQMAISVANAVMLSYKNNKIDKQIIEKELIKEFVNWLNDKENNRAPGMTCLQSCEKLEKGLRWQDATSKNSKGCGANMRVTPLALLKFKNNTLNQELIAQIAQFQSAITHAHPTALVASELTTIAMIKIIEGVSSHELLDELLEYAKQQRSKYYENWLTNIWERPGIVSPENYIERGWEECIKVINNVAIQLHNDDGEIDPCELTGEGWIAEESLGTALFCYLASPNDTVKTLIRAVNTKGDSDSIACIAGAFAGANNGVKSIPSQWIERLEYRYSKEINKYIDFILS